MRLTQRRDHHIILVPADYTFCNGHGTTDCFRHDRNPPTNNACLANAKIEPLSQLHS
jgi:hypothetical protein